METELRAARLGRNWTQEHLIREITRVAEQLRLNVASPASLKVLVSRWENGHSIPGREYRSILRRIFADEGYRFDSTRADPAAPGPVPEVISKVPEVRDPEIIAHYHRLLDRHALTDNVIGPWFALRGVFEDLKQTHQLSLPPREPLRSGLLRVRAWQMGRIAWLSAETGDLVCARTGPIAW